MRVFPRGRAGSTVWDERPMTTQPFSIAAATPADVPEIQALVRALADYERLDAACVSTEADLHEALFGSRPPRR